MDNEKITNFLLNGIEEMDKIIKKAGTKNFDVNTAKLKILANNSMSQTVKALLQYEIISRQLEFEKEKNSLEIHNILSN